MVILYAGFRRPSAGSVFADSGSSRIREDEVRAAGVNGGERTLACRSGRAAVHARRSADLQKARRCTQFQLRRVIRPRERGTRRTGYLLTRNNLP